MAKFIDIEQNTEEWLQLRCGKLGGSSIAKVMANLGKAFGEPAKKYAVALAVQQLTGKAEEQSYTNEHMQRGHEQEPIARMMYENETFCDVSNGGFFDDGFIGLSPDGLVEDNGLIEIKSVVAGTHYSTIKRMNVDPSYKWQCYLQLKVTGREWLDFVSYCSEFPVDKQLFIYRIYAKDLAEEFSQIDSRVKEFKALVESSKEVILNTNYINQ
jgi:hypothetical protein